MKEVLGQMIDYFNYINQIINIQSENSDLNDPTPNATIKAVKSLNRTAKNSGSIHTINTSANDVS